MGHHYIGTEHLLLGLVLEGDGIAVNVLRGLGIDVARVRSQTTRNILQNRPGQKTKKESKTPLVDQLGYDLTAAAEENRSTRSSAGNRKSSADPGSSRRTKNSPALIGNRALARRPSSKDWRSASSMAMCPNAAQQAPADARRQQPGGRHHVRGQFEERLKKVIEEVIASQSILFIDEVHYAGGRQRRQQRRCGQYPQAGAEPGASCRSSAPRRWTNIASTSRATPRWNGASNRFWWKSPPLIRRWRFSRV